MTSFCIPNKANERYKQVSLLVHSLALGGLILGDEQNPSTMCFLIHKKPMSALGPISSIKKARRFRGNIYNGSGKDITFNRNYKVCKTFKIVCVSKYPKISDSLQLRNSKYILAKTWDRKDWQTQELTKLKIWLGHQFSYL